MKIESINSDNMILQRRFLDLKYINDILKEELLSVSVRVHSEKHGIQSFLISKEEALALLEPRISDLEKKVEAL